MGEVLIDRSCAVELAALIVGPNELLVDRGGAVECADVRGAFQHIRGGAVDVDVDAPRIVRVTFPVLAPESSHLDLSELFFVQKLDVALEGKSTHGANRTKIP